MFLNCFRKSSFVSPICRYEAICNALSYQENTGETTLIRTSQTHAQAFIEEGKVPLVRKNGYITPGKWDKALSGPTIDWPVSYFVDHIFYESKNLAALLEANYLKGKEKR